MRIPIKAAVGQGFGVNPAVYAKLGMKGLGGLVPKNKVFVVFGGAPRSKHKMSRDLTKGYFPNLLIKSLLVVKSYTDKIINVLETVLVEAKSPGLLTLDWLSSLILAPVKRGDLYVNPLVLDEHIEGRTKALPLASPYFTNPHLPLMTTTRGSFPPRLPISPKRSLSLTVPYVPCSLYTGIRTVFWSPGWFSPTAK